MSLQSEIEAISNRTKVRISKPANNPDDRVSLVGSPVLRDENGRQYFEVPAHAADYQVKLHPHYELGEVFVDEPVKKGRAGKGE